MEQHTREVKRYYDDNTRLFLTLGQGTEGTIHRAVWGAGVTHRDQAMAYVDELVLARLNQATPEGAEPYVVDLGAGVCASLCRMAKRRPLRGTGITVSSEQAALAQERIRALGLEGSVSCVEGDFCALPSLERADFAFAIESFIHAAAPALFFQQAAKLIRPGGTLIVCDDFLARRGESEARARRWLERVRRGWLLGHLTSEATAQEYAAQAGFQHRESLDLTPMLELGRPRDYAIAALMRCLGWLPIRNSYWAMLYGGHALQHCLERRYLEYRFNVWQRSLSEG